MLEIPEVVKNTPKITSKDIEKTKNIFLICEDGYCWYFILLFITISYLSDLTEKNSI